MGIAFKRVHDQRSLRFPRVWGLYESSFPRNERRDIRAQKLLFHKLNYRLLAFYEGSAFSGFVSYWSFPSFIFIEHIAVEPRARSKGLGTAVLTAFMKRSGKAYVAEAEPSGSSADADRRLKFYSRLGFKLNCFEYVQPPYRKKDGPVPLVVLSAPRLLSRREFLAFRRQVYRDVYHYSSESGRGSVLAFLGNGAARFMGVDARKPER
ncbi:MAG: GNAT family N-acetyltransferase [Candidatus Bilamarchaeaceae archaeon]